MPPDPSASANFTAEPPGPGNLVQFELPLALFDRRGDLIEASQALQELLGADMEISWSHLLGKEASLAKLRRQLKAQPGNWIAVESQELKSHQVWLGLKSLEPEAAILALLLPKPRAEGSAARQAFDSLPVGLVLFDANETVALINPALEELLHLPAASLVGQQATSFWRQVANASGAPEIAEASFKRAAASPEARPRAEIKVAEEPDRHLQVSFFQVAGAGSGAIFSDISQARDQVNWKLELLSMLANDLRTPLASLKGHASALTSNYSHWSQSMVLEFLEAMDQGVDDLVRQVDRSLALTRLESGRLGLNPAATSPQVLIQGALERAASALGELSLQTTFSENLPQVRVDPARIEEVLIHLLENAARYSPSDQPITVAIESSPVMTTFTVMDQGRGVPTGRRNSIFEKYNQFEDDHEGPGLGLFISQQIVEAHGGRIWVESPPPGQDRGSAFSFTVPNMPAEPVQQAGDDRTATVPPAEAEGTILVVEGEMDLQALFKAILEPAGYQVALANSGPAALDYLATHEPAAVILDLMLPRMDGLTVCRTLRRRSSLPIFVLTSKASAEDLVAAVDAGADDYLTKPFQSTELLARLRALLRRSQRWRQQPSARPLTFGFGELEIDVAQRQVLAAGEPVQLTPMEYELLIYMAQHKGQVLTHNQIIETLWPLGKGNRHSLFVHINRLRAKIEPDPDEPRYILTRWGVGYAFMPIGRS